LCGVSGVCGATPVSGSDNGFDDAAGDIVLQVEKIAERRLHGVRRQHRAAWRFDELRHARS
jgi:hypothetical protein